jgi:hypothetical protein
MYCWTRCTCPYLYRRPSMRWYPMRKCLLRNGHFRALFLFNTWGTEACNTPCACAHVKWRCMPSIPSIDHTRRPYLVHTRHIFVVSAPSSYGMSETTENWLVRSRQNGLPGRFAPGRKVRKMQIRVFSWLLLLNPSYYICMDTHWYPWGGRNRYIRLSRA